MRRFVGIGSGGGSSGSRAVGETAVLFTMRRLRIPAGTLTGSRRR